MHVASFTSTNKWFKKDIAIMNNLHSQMGNILIFKDFTLKGAGILSNTE